MVQVKKTTFNLRAESSTAEFLITYRKQSDSTESVSGLWCGAQKKIMTVSAAGSFWYLYCLEV